MDRPSRNWHSGMMRHRILVQQPTHTQDADGQPIPTWSTRFASEPASFVYTGGGQILRGRQVEEGIIAVFTVRYRDGYSTTDRIVFDGVTYGIVHVRPVMGLSRYIELHCRAVAP